MHGCTGFLAGLVAGIPVACLLVACRGDLSLQFADLNRQVAGEWASSENEVKLQMRASWVLRSLRVVAWSRTACAWGLHWVPKGP